MISKQKLRKTLLQQRKRLSEQQLTGKSLQLVQNLRQCPWVHRAATIFAYRSFRQEVSLQALYTATVQQYQWGFPRCVGQDLAWHQWTGQSASEFLISSYGIEEPRPDWPRLEQADLILVPTVACDRRGYRLGYGGGYYDRMLAMPQNSSTRTIGIVLDEFLFDQLPIDEWDQPLNAICTESGCFEVMACST